ncbi:824309c7-f528-479b-95fa-1169344889fe [Thermothielavioides terrestris]|uniref:824309c7-f528-479b-95fa-1169344889fe n=1 Tax=Thermothielavioides terrestris TaxID=2587410 RepID=A0A3S4AQS8_9PEZI|nr:824309c7-f528-479b-95fa-1169344889fe [Thermothielavioides terrestris]
MAGTRPNFDKRMSKDDLALMGMGMGKGRERGLQPYMTAQPLPEAHAISAGRPVASGQTLDAAIVDLWGDPDRDGAGKSDAGFSTIPPESPTSRPYFGWQPQSQVSVQISSSPSPAQTPEPPIQRTKTQKRRLFGSLFGRKQAEPPKAPEASDVNRSVSSTWVPGANNDAAPARSNTVRKTPKHKPIVIRSNTEPFSDAAVPQESWPSISGTSSSLSTNKPGLLDVEIPDIRLERYSVMFSGVLNANGTKSSLLERRQATLEKLKTISDGREDEMVEERTRPRRATSPQPGKSPAFSLFPQTPTRQSGVEAVSTSLAPPSRGLTRSNTSPAYLPSPARATFEAGQQPSAPEHLARKERKTVTIVSPRTMDERDRAAKVEKLREQQQQQQRQQAHQQHPLRSHPQPAMASTTATFHLDPDESALILDSPESISSPFSSPASSSYDSASSPQRAKPGPALIPSLRPTIPEPEWQILTPPSSTSSASTASNASTGTTTTTASTLSTTTTTPAAKRSRSATVSASTSTSTSASGSVRASRPSIDDDESTAAAAAALPRVSVDEQDAALKAAVESSIARQISISRQQRQLLMRPFGPGQGALSAGSAASSASGAGGKTGGASGGVAGGKNGKGKGAGVGLGLGGWENGYANGQRHGQGQGQAQGQAQVTVGVIKGRVTPVMVGGGAAGDRRSERVVLDVVR